MTTKEKEIIIMGIGVFAVILFGFVLIVLYAMEVEIPWISNIVDISYDNAQKYECEKAGMKWHYEKEFLGNGAIVVCGY